MTSRIRIFSDVPLMIFAAFGYLITSAGGIALIWLLSLPGAVADPDDIVPMQITFAFLLFIFSVAIVITISKRVCLITLSHNAITIKTAFTKKKSFSYKRFPFVYHGKYVHGNAFGYGVMMHYIVFSQRPISKGTLCTINNFECTHDAFKIRYTKKNYAKLCKIVPFDVHRKLDFALTEMKSR